MYGLKLAPDFASLASGEIEQRDTVVCFAARR